MRGDEKKDEKKEGGGEEGEGSETWREFGTVRYQAKAHTSASSANLIPLTMCTRRNLLTSPFLGPTNASVFPVFISPPAAGERWPTGGKTVHVQADAHPPTPFDV